jgi:hypothetical protein
VCEGSIDFTESFIGEIAGQLPEGLALSEPVTVQYVTGETLDQEDPCGIPGLKCASRGHAYTTDAVDLHELVHAVRELAYAGHVPGPAVLEEGLAVLFSSDAQVFPAGHLDLGELDHIGLDDPLSGPDYPRAGHFVSYLATVLGMLPLVEFVGAAEGLEVVDDYASIYAASTQRDWNADLAAYSDYPACELYELAHRPVECGDDTGAVVLEEGTAHTLVDLSDFGCGHEQGIGPVLGRVWAYAVVDVPDVADTTWFLDLVVDLPDDSGFEVQVVSCEGGCASGFTGFRSSERDLFEAIEFSPGRSIVRFSQDVGAVSDIEIRLTEM